MEENQEISEHKVHTFVDSDKTMIAVADEKDPSVILLGVFGFNLGLVYDKERLRTMNDIQNAAENLVANIVQMLLDDQLALSQETTESS